ncbi:hypothetical protein JCGZ_16660 [Jatropha curcas]|uniref:Uncharacterized protein n=1 Tax=Jatropha curcas TaxID=180498 RepID=A0A067KFT4_JATCU|nr:hypothetical protein JCGZ_16660 [Jatropha curcas]
MVSVHAVDAGNERNHARSDAALRFLFSGDSRRFGQIFGSVVTSKIWFDEDAFEARFDRLEGFQFDHLATYSTRFDRLLSAPVGSAPVGLHQRSKHRQSSGHVQGSINPKAPIKLHQRSKHRQSSGHVQGSINPKAPIKLHQRSKHQQSSGHVQGSINLKAPVGLHRRFERQWSSGHVQGSINLDKDPGSGIKGMRYKFASMAPHVYKETVTPIIEQRTR